MKLLGFAKCQSSQDFIFTGLFIMAKSWNYAPENKVSFKSLRLWEKTCYFDLHILIKLLIDNS